MSTQINILLQGGLGNQLFQLTWAKYIESVLKTKVSCNSNMLLSKGIHGGIRLSDLFVYDHHQFSESCVFFESGNIAKAARFFLRKLDIRHVGKYVFHDYDAATSFEQARSAMDSRFHFGYFQYVQSALYFRDELRSLITQRYGELIAIGRELYANCVGVHVRRGDFLLSTDPRHKVMDEDYYHKAIQRFEGRRFVVFTDDRKWCAEVFNGQDFEVCGLLSTEVKPAIADFLSLLCCKDYIIGASTFAWWAAFLSINSDATVYMPKLDIPFLSESSNQLIGWNYIFSD